MIQLPFHSLEKVVRTMGNQARNLGIRFRGAPGKTNTIGDVSGIGVGHSTIIGGQLVGQRARKKKKVRAAIDPTVNTGVTVVVPDSGSSLSSVVNCGFFSLNGNGEMTGTHLIEESGILQGPILLTNTASLGTVRSQIIQYGFAQNISGYLLPVVAETDDSLLNNILNDSITQAMVESAFDDANDPTNGGSVAEGSVGGGTGMTCYDWKGGIGSSSRQVTVNGIGYDGTKFKKQTVTVGVLVQANQGTYDELMVFGVPVGRLKGFPIPNLPDARASRRKRSHTSIIVVIGTDAPLQPHQLKRLARRGAHGIARTGTSTHDDSGELCIAFSKYFTTDVLKSSNKGLAYIDNDAMDPLFTATVQATEEAIINALLAATAVTGPGGFTATTLSAPTLVDALNNYNPMTANFVD
jgi:D-aminopeptidase